MLSFKTKIGGGFFKYNHKLNFDLTELQIYRADDQKDYSVMCFVKALETYGLDKVIVNKIKMKIQTSILPMCKIKQIAEEFDLHITIKRVEDNSNLIRYGNKTKKQINLGLIDEHFFLIKPMEITSFSIKNYELVKNERDWYKINKMRKNKYFIREKNYINSFALVKLLIENKDKLLRKIELTDEIYRTPFYKKIDDIQTLCYNENQVILNTYEPKEKDTYVNYYIDFETITSSKIHIPYLVRIAGFEEEFLGEKCGKSLLNHICKHQHKKKLGDKIRLIGHNVAYDLRFLFEYLHKPTLIERNNMLLRGYAKFNYFGKIYDVQIQDSYALISMKLSKFGKTFNLNVEKEILPYDLYNETNVKKRFIHIDECLKCVNYQFDKNNIGKIVSETDKVKFKNDFLLNCKKWNCILENKIDIVKYSSEYCKMDCEVLKAGYEKFKEWIFEITTLDINNYVSMPSLADAYMQQQGVYDGVYKLCGNVREFIQRCMVGGRTMTKQNIKQKVYDALQDVDATSLYPSAMNRLEGYLLGKPKIIENLDLKWIMKQDGYFIECKIKKVGKKYNFPLMSKKTTSGIREFTNEMEGSVLYLDKISLEDLIEFQKVDLDVIRGYYYNEGRNNKLTNVIKYLFNERLRKKKLKNPIEIVYKLFMNSAYGKTLLKPIETENKYISYKNFDNYIYRYYSYIKDVTKINKWRYKIKQYKPINEHYNNAHCGVEVLSMSKRIMNEVMCTAEDNNIDIYYQDTDSMHIKSEDISKLEKAYNCKYDKQLIGKNMGQFHPDFDSDIIKKDIQARGSIFLGKKCYIDKLEGLDQNNRKVYDYHIRMKGVSNESILEYAFDHYQGDCLKMYEDMYRGKEIEFDLLCGGKKISFTYNKNMTISSKTMFTRLIKF